MGAGETFGFWVMVVRFYVERAVCRNKEVSRRYSGVAVLCRLELSSLIFFEASIGRARRDYIGSRSHVI